MLTASDLITLRDKITSLRTNPELLLNAPALIPLDQHASDSHQEDDLYIFAFLTGLVTTSHKDLHKALESDQPIYLMHALPNAWSKPTKWVSLTPLTLKSESDSSLSVEIGGQGENRDYLTSKLILPPKERVNVEENFYSLSSLHVEQLPDARVGVHSPVLGKPVLITPFDWGNIWVYGMDIFLTGYLTYGEFGRRASLMPLGSNVFQYARTRTKNLTVTMTELKPLPGLFERARKWELTKHKREMN